MTYKPPSLAREVLAFWFAGALESAAAAQARSKTWFAFDADFDGQILRRFGHLPEQAAAGNLDPWTDAAESALARLIVLDQFPRNLYRHDSRSYVFDALALAGSQAAIASGYDALVHPLHAVFMYLPFEHAEDLGMQQRSVALFEALQNRAPAGCEPQFESFADYARRHRDIIARFGRFPHRNAVLLRASTPAEIEYLEGGGERFGPKAR
jgi:uncharacterized protein (DUF924 family)